MLVIVIVIDGAADTRLRMSYGVAGGRRYTALKD